MRHSLLNGVATLIITACLSGCGGSNGLYPVSGKVFVNGEPAAGATIYFHRKEVTDRFREPVAMAVVEDDGTFSISSADLGKGATPGLYDVLIEWKEGSNRAKGRKPALRAHDRLKGRYCNARKPLLQAEVKPQSNYLPPFELK